jgi:4-hydroxy-2-oxoheptanedioate aldolase
MKSFRSALESGQPQLGLGVMYPAPGVIERIGAEWDWIWVDGQHGELGYPDLLAMVRACDLVERPALVRVPSHEFGAIGLMLDMGATGVIVPVVDTPEEAKAVVKAAKFPPLGGRSYGGRRPIDRQGRLYSDSANTETLLIVQIESPEAVANADRIAAVPGVDALFLGPDDITLRRGGKMDAPISKEMLEKDMAAVSTACKKHNKFAVCIGVGADMLTLALKYGFNLVVSGSDVMFLAKSSKQVSAEARELVKGHASAEKPKKGKTRDTLY